MRRRRGLGAADRIGGYPKDNGRVLADGHGNALSTSGHKVGCTKVKPFERGAWISSERCSYRFKVDGRWYACRGRGDGIAASCRVMKKLPHGFSGARRRRR